MTLLNEALNEQCRVVTKFGTRSEMILKDYDNVYALFKDKREGVVILPLTEIKALEFDDEQSKDGKCL